MRESEFLRPTGISVHTIGWILMIVGIVGGVLLSEPKQVKTTTPHHSARF